MHHSKDSPTLTPSTSPARALEEDELRRRAGLTDGEDGGLLKREDVGGVDAVRLVLRASRSDRAHMSTSTSAHLEVEDDVGVVGELEGQDEPDYRLVRATFTFSVQIHLQPEN
jgi:hypothetical protein